MVPILRCRGIYFISMLRIAIRSRNAQPDTLRPPVIRLDARPIPEFDSSEGQAKSNLKLAHRESAGDLSECG